ncbi:MULTISPECIES: PAS domain S-box protein [unclassified Pedobacter]|uniref:PAS domain S-box protein n=1 Tax=unclassified Pedobacter TaxID=2628915 RepID=UPI001D338050|nr:MULTISPECIES: PAS domain S-box protein [unclassified Pedobacter]CAH0174980.1 Sensor histidine kinase WalK [Pedobacter sp. Bi36]CAH0230899.1 Sensor histidine kinase WalK [Pedobacter sp. Bi126]
MSYPNHLLSSDQLLEVFNLTHTATAVHVGETAIIQAANDAMLSIWGKDRSVIGKSLEDALPELRGQPFIEMFRKVWLEGLVISGKDTAADLVIDGKLQTFYFDFEYRAIKNDAGKTICILHTAIDVSERVFRQQAVEQALEREEALQREQTLNEELAATVEELATTNEELVATNEELQETQETLHVLNNELELRVVERFNQLSESEKRFRTMAEGTDIFIAVADESGNAVYFNKSWVKLTGRSMKDLLDFGWADLIHPEDRDRYINIYLSALAEKKPFTGEFRILTKKGDYRWLLASGPPRFHADGSFAGYISSCIDITERKLIEIERLNLNKLIEASSEFIGIAELDMSIQYLNPAALQKLGWSGISNRTILDCVFPEDRLMAEKILPEILKNNTFRQEIRFWNEKTGHPFWIEWNGFAIRNETDEIVAIATVSPDITERKLYQEELQGINMEMAAANEELATTNEELAKTHDDLIKYTNKLSDSEEKLRQAIETGRMGTWSINPKTLEVTMSSFVKDLLGLPLDKPAEMDMITKAVNPDYHNMLISALDNAMKNHSPSDMEYPINNLINGQEKWVRATGRVFLDQQGNPTEYSGLFIDITEQKLDEIRKNDFIGMVSHELKTPLTAINGFVQVLQRKAKKDEDNYAIIALDKAHSQIRKMTAMINGFLNVSRLESGKLLIEKTNFSLDELLKETIEETYVSQSSHQIILNPTCEVNINADRNKIGNVLSNLISNGLKYSDNGTRIEITCKLHDTEVEIQIKDEGIGIKPEDIDKLFERYYRVQGNHTISGFGIGLYLSAEIIERHGGQIWAESEEGKGSVFHFTLPLG